MSPPIPQLDFSLTNISGLPDDLRAAHNSAVWLASEAQTICKTVLGGQISIIPNASNLVALVVNNIRRERNGCKAAIDAVVLELAKVRKRRIRFGSIVAATAHEAAIELSQNVVQAVWFGCTFVVDEKDERAMKNHQKALDIWQRVHSDPSARYDSDCIIENYEGVVRYFGSQKTEWPSADEIIAEVKLESAKAASRRRPSTVNHRKSKKSTQNGDATVKLIAALTAHHKYADGACLNFDPIGGNELARQAEVSTGSASHFFKSQFGEEGAHAKYRALCRNKSKLIGFLKNLNREFTPDRLYGGAPPE